MLSAGSRCVTYLPNLRAVINRVRPLTVAVKAASNSSVVGQQNSESDSCADSGKMYSTMIKNIQSAFT